VRCPAGVAVDLEALLVTLELDEAVIKPAVSLSAWETWRTSPASAPSHQARLDALLAATS
jgi:hypothetical protein